MKTEEFFANNYIDCHKNKIIEVISEAYIEGYRQGLMESDRIRIDGVTYCDLGLPSGTLWSISPIHLKHKYTYITYDMQSYDKVASLNIPSVEDFLEIQKHCMVTINSGNMAKDVVIIGPNGNRITIGTMDYKNNPSNPCSVTCRRLGEEVAKYTNMFWIKSDLLSEQKATVGVVDYNEKMISCSSYFTGFKLPYFLVKRCENLI